MRKAPGARARRSNEFDARIIDELTDWPATVRQAAVEAYGGNGPILLRQVLLTIRDREGRVLTCPTLYDSGLASPIRMVGARSRPAVPGPSSIPSSSSREKRDTCASAHLTRGVV
jgi:hypothetical protein